MVRRFKNRQTLRFTIQGKPYYLKRYMPLPWYRAIGAALSGGILAQSALAELRALQKLQRIGIPAPIPAGWGVRRDRSFIVTEGLDNTCSLEDHVATWHARAPDPGHRRSLLSAVADTTRLLHGCGINHRDLYLCHFHLDLGSAAESPRLYLLDLHRAELRGRVPVAKQLKDLGALYSSAYHLNLGSREKLRFIRQYHAVPLNALDDEDWRFWKRVSARAYAIWRRNALKRMLPKGAQPALCTARQTVWTTSELAEYISGRRAAADLPFVCELHDRGAKRYRLCVQAVLARQAPHHVVLRAHLDGRSVVAKIFRLDSARGRRRWRRTVAGNRQLAERGMPTPELLATWRSFERGAGLGIVLMKDLGRTRAARTGDFEQVLSLTKRLHRHGLVHVDAHLNNFTWARSRLYVLDSDGIRATRRSARQRHHLARLFVRCLPLSLQEEAAGKHGIDRDALSTVRRKRVSGSTGEYCRSGKDFMRVKRGRRTIVTGRRGEHDGELLRWLEEIDQLHADTVLKAGSRSSVFCARYKEDTLVVKYYFNRGLWHQLVHAAQHSRARRYWCNAQRLARYTQVGTPPPVALVEERRGPFTRRAWLVTRYQAGVRLDHLLAEGAPSASIDAEIGKFFRTLRQLCISHGDTKASNFIVADGRLFVVDLDSMRVHRRDHAKYYARDVERFLGNFAPGSAERRHYRSLIAAGNAPVTAV